jgi:hypothetical protein
VSRHLFGGTTADYVIALGDVVTVGSITGNAAVIVPGVAVSFFDAETGGTQITDLLDGLGTATSTVTSDSNGAIPVFSGPDNGSRSLWADANSGAGPRRLMVATDIGSDLSTAESDIAGLQTSVGGLATVAATGDYADLLDTPPLAAVATSGAYSDLTGTPAPGLQYVAKIGGSWPVRASTAPDTGRPAMWIGPSPAPSSGTPYALPGDLWIATPA